QDVFSREWTELSRFIHGIACLEGSHAINELIKKLVVNFVCNHKSLCRNARLAGVDGARFYRCAQCALEVCARHHNERIAAAELEHAFLDLSRCGARHCAPGFFATSQGYRFHARIDNHFFHLLRSNEQSLESALGGSHATRALLNDKRALRDYVRLR